LHQPASVVRIGGPSIALSMLLPLLVMAVAFTLLFVWLLLLRMRAALNQRKIEALRLHAPALGVEIATETAIPAARPALR
jgi:heme exporter protein C